MKRVSVYYNICGICKNIQTFSSQGECHRVNLLATILSFTERLVCNTGSVLRDITGGPDVNHKPKRKKNCSALKILSYMRNGKKSVNDLLVLTILKEVKIPIARAATKSLCAVFDSREKRSAFFVTLCVTDFSRHSSTCNHHSAPI